MCCNVPYVYCSSVPTSRSFARLSPRRLHNSSTGCPHEHGRVRLLCREEVNPKERSPREGGQSPSRSQTGTPDAKCQSPPVPDLPAAGVLPASRIPRSTSDTSSETGSSFLKGYAADTTADTTAGRCSSEAEPGRRAASGQVDTTCPGQSIRQSIRPISCRLRRFERVTRKPRCEGRRCIDDGGVPVACSVDSIG